MYQLYLIFKIMKLKQRKKFDHLTFAHFTHTLTFACGRLLQAQSDADIVHNERFSNKSQQLINTVLAVSTPLPSQSAPTILVLKTLGSDPEKNQVQNMDLKKAGCKKQGHSYSKREEARLPLLFLNNNDLVFSYSAFRP